LIRLSRHRPSPWRSSQEAEDERADPVAHRLIDGPEEAWAAASGEYQAPATLREAIDLLVSDPEATVIAGGQSLIPVLAFRLAAPSMLVDLRRVPGLGNIAVGESGVRLGARVRWRDIEHDRRLATAHPLLREAIAHVAHYQIRNRGTVGGSLAHADPAAELPGIAVTCDAEITLVGAAGVKTIRAGEFLHGAIVDSAPSGRDYYRIAPAVLAGASALGLSGIRPEAG
jgi:CO/xanthine dehydrogenase FAD-binding subunit